MVRIVSAENGLFTPIFTSILPFVSCLSGKKFSVLFSSSAEESASAHLTDTDSMYRAQNKTVVFDQLETVEHSQEKFTQK